MDILTNRIVHSKNFKMMEKNLIIAYTWVLNLTRRIAMLSDFSMKLLFVPGFEKLRFFNGKMKMKAEFYKAIKNVPAYKDIAKNRTDTNLIPETSKDTFVKKYSIANRCVGGRIPDKGVIIDESSGSSGVPTNWVRGAKERATNMRYIEFGVKQLFDNKPKVIINAFAMGSWATGINVSMASVLFSKVKSTGPDCDKIQNTIKQFGTDEEYIIMGYPPFLKFFVDTVDLDLKKYKINMVMGGEAMSEGLRTYLQAKGIQKVFSSYGASDLELNICTENDFTIKFRKLLIEQEELRKDLLIDNSIIPMVFQFNPADFYIETNDDDELLISICRTGYIAPKIRYNIKDKGQIIRYSELENLLKKYGIDTSILADCPTDLPLLLHFGRSDQTVSFFGSNISPNDIQEVIFKMPQITDKVNSFCMLLKEDKETNKQLEIHLESPTKKIGFRSDKIRKDFLKVLSNVNQDFKEALRMLPINQQPKLILHGFGSGPFNQSDIRIKTQYIR